MEYKLMEPFCKEKIKDFRAGDKILVTGTIYTARDAAHKRMTELLDKGEPLPFDMIDSIIWGLLRQSRDM